MESSWNIGSIGFAGPPLRGPSSPRVLAEPPLSPPVSAGPSPVASAQPLEPSVPIAPPVAPTAETASTPQPPFPGTRPATSLESLLMRFRLITSEQLDEALREKRETGRDVGAIVVERGWINEDQLARLLSYAPAFGSTTEAAEATSEPVETPTEPASAEAEPAFSEPETTAADPEMFQTDAFHADPEPILEPEPEPDPLPAAIAEVPAAEVAPAATHELPPALELLEPDEVPTPEPEALAVDAPAQQAEYEVVAETADVPAEPTPLAPVQPAVFEPIAEPIAAPEPEAALPAPQPEPEPEPAAAPDPEPEPEPAALTIAPEPQAVRFVEPPAVETIARVFVRLSNGDRVEAGSFDDVSAAKARAEEVVRQVASGNDGWPFVGGRYIRPEAVVSVDVDATVVRYA